MSEHFRKLILDGYVAGYDTPIALVRNGLGIDLDSPIYSELLKRARELMEDPVFRAEAQKYRMDRVAYTMKSFREDSMRYKLHLDRIIEESPIESNRLAAIKDALNRAGTAPAQKSVFFSPTDYAEAVEKDWLGPREDEEELRDPSTEG